MPIILFAVSTTVTPGPNNAMLMASGVNHGVRGSVPHVIGINLGFPVMVILIGLGLGAVFDALPFLHSLIRVLGVAYLLYLAWLIAATPTADLDRGSAKPLSFWQAVFFQWVNPKAWVIVTGAIATYTTQEHNIYGQVLAIAGVFCVVGFPSSTIWLLGGAALRKALSNPRRQRAFNVVMALLLVGSICPVIWEIVAG